MRIFCPMDQVTNFKKKNVESEKNVFFVFNINNFGFTFSIYIDVLIVCLLLVYAFFYMLLFAFFYCCLSSSKIDISGKFFLIFAVACQSLSRQI